MKHFFCRFGVFLPLMFGAVLSLNGDGAIGEVEVGSKPLFFEVIKGDQVHYLLGTIHAGKKGMYPMPEPIYDALRVSEVLALEIDLDEDSLDGFQGRMLDVARLPEGTNLFELLPSELFFRLERVLYSNRIHLIERLDMQPWFYSLLLNALPVVSGSYRSGLGVETHLKGLREVRGMELYSIECVDEQVGYFASGSLDEQVEILRYFLIGWSEMSASLDRMYRAWREGDLSVFEEQIKGIAGAEDSGVISAFWEGLLHERNRNMAERVKQLAEERKGIFVAVGAMHLVGDTGLPSLLEASGYTVRRVVFDGMVLRKEAGE